MPSSRQCLDNLIEAASRTLQLPLCLHLTGSIQPSPPWRIHNTAPCLMCKRDNLAACREYDGRTVHLELARAYQGRIHRCPFGYTELAVPLRLNNRHLGVLFAGPAWTDGASPPHRDLPVISQRQWLLDRLVVLECVAMQLVELVNTATDPADDRRLTILHYIEGHLGSSLTLAALANNLSLSPSRVRHLVRERFGMSLGQLIQEMRLHEAAHLLAITDLPVGEIATKVGMAHPSYFARQFKRYYGHSPRQHRIAFE